MKWFRRIVGEREDTAHAAVPAHGRGRFTVAVVGESSYLGTLTEAKSSARDDIIDVLLECEPRNRWDKNAVRVATMAGHTIGYLERAIAARYHGPIAARGNVATCRAVLRGGDEERPNIGVWLDLCSPEDL